MSNFHTAYEFVAKTPDVAERLNSQVRALLEDMENKGEIKDLNFKPEQIVYGSIRNLFEDPESVVPARLKFADIFVPDPEDF